MSSTDGLAQAARFLRNAAPREFEQFCEAFAGYFEDKRKVLLRITENWQQAQGHAQQCEKIMDVLLGVRKNV